MIEGKPPVNLSKPWVGEKSNNEGNNEVPATEIFIAQSALMRTRHVHVQNRG